VGFPSENAKGDDTGVVATESDHRNCKRIYLHCKTGLKNGERKITDPSRSTSHSPYERETFPSAHINNVKLLQEEDVRHLELHLDRRLSWHKHILEKRKQLGITLTKLYWLLGHKSKLSKSNKLLIYKTMLNQSGLTEYNSGGRLPLPT
jgi:hypothetical protein